MNGCFCSVKSFFSGLSVKFEGNEAVNALLSVLSTFSFSLNLCDFKFHSCLPVCTFTDQPYFTLHCRNCWYKGIYPAVGASHESIAVGTVGMLLL